MKREEVKNKIPGITDEQLDWLMGENGRDVTAEKTKAASLQGQVDDLTKQLNTAKDGLKAFEGVDVADLKGQITKLQGQLTDQADSFTVGAVSSTYIGSKVTKKSAQTYTPGTSDQTIGSGQYLSGTQTIKGDSNLVGSNILSGKTIFGVPGSVVIQRYYTGSSEPSSSTGSNGDLYLQTGG